MLTNVLNRRIYHPKADDGSHVAAAILRSMSEALPNVEVFHSQTATGVVMNGSRIIGVKVVDQSARKSTFYGKVVIDATREGTCGQHNTLTLVRVV